MLTANATTKQRKCVKVIKQKSRSMNFIKSSKLQTKRKGKNKEKKTTVTSGTISKIPFFIYKPIDIEIEIVKKSKT